MRVRGFIFRGSTLAKTTRKTSKPAAAKSKTAAKPAAKASAKKPTAAQAKAAAQKAKLNQAKQTAQQAGARAQVQQAQQGQAQMSEHPLKGASGDKMAAIGSACWLMGQMVTHKHLFMTDIEWLVTPPVALGQFRLWHKDGVPVAYASWAYLNEEAENRMKVGGHKLAPIDWKSGSNLWLMDVLAPFGGNEEVVKELREKVFPGKKIKTLQPAPGGSGMAVVEW